MKKTAYYAEKSLMDFESKDTHRENRERSGILSEYGYTFVSEDGIAVVGITTPLSAEYDWGIDYKTLGSLLEQLEADDSVKVVVLDINSPGGDVSGLFDLCEQIQSYEKPIYAYTSGNLASAAYTIAAATDGIYAQESANIGSVGVFLAFYDDSERLQKQGIKEISFYGKNSDNKNLSPETEKGKKVYQAEVDELEEMLIRNIARYRGISEQAVLDNFGHGLMFRGKEALERGMIDGVVTDYDSFLETIADKAKNNNGGTAMAVDKKLAKSVEEIDSEFLNELLADARAQALEEARAEFEKQSTEKAEAAVSAERERVACLNKYASLANADIAAMAEQAKADGTSVSEFMEKFNAKAFEVFSQEKPQNSLVNKLAAEAHESGNIDTGVNVSQGGQKTDSDVAKELAEKTKARLFK